MESRAALFRNPTLEAATAYCRAAGFPEPQDPLEPLAIVHHQRLRWIDATDAMLAESAQFFRDHPTLALRIKGPHPLTPITRDMRRVMAGKPPLAVQAPK